MFCLEMYFRKIKLGITSKRFCACNNENGIMSFRMQSINQILMLSITYFSLRGICCNFCLLTLLFNSKNKPFNEALRFTNRNNLNINMFDKSNSKEKT